MKTSNEILDSINAFIEQLPYDRKPYSLYEPIQYVLSLGGKRIRPALMLLSYQLYLDHPEDILMPAVALETYHNYTLLHDDLMDNADLRRGHATVHKRWDANTAILSGDSMLVLAYERLLSFFSTQHPTPNTQPPTPNTQHPILALFTETALQIGEGQQYDMEFERRNDVREEEYIEMIRLKTSVLLACAMKMGAILAGATDADADNLYKYGEQIGLAFQLQDDLLDVYGDSAVFGKAIGGDITSNKKTYMLINALLRANDEQRAELNRWIAATDFDRQEKVAAVTELYNQIGIRQLCEEKINYYFEQAKQYLTHIHVPEERKQPLIDFTNEMMHRDK
jgi:geranylgeranyl diphosphate synthase type II